jgi:hypothetical protein
MAAMPGRASGAHAAASRATGAPACGPSLAPRARWQRELRLRHAAAPGPARRAHEPLLARARAVEAPPWALRASLGAPLARALAALSGRLDVLLEAPLRVREAGDTRRVTVLEVAVFQVRPAEQALMRTRPGRMPACFQLVPLLSTQEWRETLLALLARVVQAGDGLGPIGPTPPRVRRWVVATVLRLLRGDARFRRLREIDAPRAFGLDPELACIGMLARLPRGCNALSSDQYAMVWSHAGLFRRAATENPQLLPLVSALLLDRRRARVADPVHVLSQRIARDLSPKAWRYVAKYGTRPLRVAWAAATEDTPLEAALAYLGMLDRAGLPPPPPRSLARAWMVVCRIGIGLSFMEAEILGDVPLPVLDAAARRHDAARANPGIAPAADTVIAVAEWYRDAELPRVAASVRDWSWLESRWREHEVRMQRFRQAGAATWTSLVGPIQYQRWRVQPLLTAREVVDASLALRNCLDRYVDHARADRIRLFVLRNQRTARLDAAIAIVPTTGRLLRWELSDVRGFANSPAPQFFALACGIARRYTRAALRVLAGDAPRPAPATTRAPRSDPRQISLWGDADDDFVF